MIRFKTKDKGHINITEHIGINTELFGILLLEDKNGLLLAGIVNDYGPQWGKINLHIIQRWLQGEGHSPKTWKTLITCLHDCKLNTLAKDIEYAVGTAHLSSLPEEKYSSSYHMHRGWGCELLCLIPIIIFLGCALLIIIINYK